MSNKGYIVRKISYSEFDDWDNVVKISPQGSVYHLSYWINTCATSMNTNYSLFGVYKNNELIAGLPLFMRKYKGLIKYGSSTISLTPYTGFLFPEDNSSKVRDNEQKRNEIIASILKEITKERLFLIKISNSPSLHDIRPFTWNGWKEKISYMYVMNLEQDIWYNISKKTRNTIRKAQKNSICTKKYWDKELYWRLNQDTYQKQGLKPPFSKKYLFDLMDLIKERDFGEMWIAQMPDGNIASAEIIIWDNKMAHRWSAASCYKYKNFGGTSLLLYDIFESLKKRGHNKMNLMAANTPHLTNFVSNFNPKLIHYYSISQSNVFKVYL